MKPTKSWKFEATNLGQDGTRPKGTLDMTFAKGPGFSHHSVTASIQTSRHSFLSKTKPNWEIWIESTILTECSSFQGKTVVMSLACQIRRSSTVTRQRVNSVQQGPRDGWTRMTSQPMLRQANVTSEFICSQTQTRFHTAPEKVNYSIYTQYIVHMSHMSIK